MTTATATKRCPTCNQTKTADCFFKAKDKPDGLTSQCKECRKAYVAANKSRYKVSKRLWYERNKEKVSQWGKEWREANRERKATNDKAYREANSEKGLARNRAYRAANRQKVADYQKQYRNDEANKLRRNTLLRERAETDTNFRIRTNLRKRLGKALENNQKSGSAVDDLGCSIPELKQHLESQFNTRMTWDNWGTYWHIDHIYPLAAADLTNRVQFLAANNWQNLQPLSEAANLKKGEKVTPAAKRLFNKLVRQFEKEVTRNE